MSGILLYFETSEWIQIMQLTLRFLVSFGFFSGIVLMVSPEAFDALNKALSREYGIKTRFIPKLELATIHILDRIITKKRSHGIIAGFVISVVSFILLLIHK
ncbi:MAG TPA: hypothetical protein PLO93_03560 [Candidatus Omnitrophota bacterium]|nr:hypothetical protein [Candidatus Omnitrophota bacterium]HQL41352.1 hypothetical protein [Candidatus Omnitrophota bacterium]